ncbi:MAG: SDR family oxidoreductase [Alphaproteobacteria bacterium]|nr:SDR family oxidoreductase [Alphaproteobacteria bacterium]
MTALETMFSLQGRVALVTGGSRGLGVALAEALASAGAHVVLAGRDRDALEANAAAIRDRGGSASTAAFDVTDEAAAAAAVAGTVRERGRLDILVNNAGLARRGAFEQYTSEDWRYVVDVNLNACFYLAREAAKPMLARGYGRIINIASIASFIARPTIAPYIATKHALAGLTKAMAVEFAARGITANAIAPGYFVTDLTRHLAADPAFNGWLTARTPAARWGEPHELGGAVVFLASPASAYVNGHILTVDGGMTASM